MDYVAKCERYDNMSEYFRDYIPGSYKTLFLTDYAIYSLGNFHNKNDYPKTKEEIDKMTGSNFDVGLLVKTYRNETRIIPVDIGDSGSCWEYEDWAYEEYSETVEIPFDSEYIVGWVELYQLTPQGKQNI